MRKKTNKPPFGTPIDAPPARKPRKVRVVAGNRPEDRSGASLGKLKLNVAQRLLDSPAGCEMAASEMGTTVHDRQYHIERVAKAKPGELRAMAASYAEQMLNAEERRIMVQRDARRLENENRLHERYCRILFAMADRGPY